MDLSAIFEARATTDREAEAKKEKLEVEEAHERAASEGPATKKSKHEPLVGMAAYL